MNAKIWNYFILNKLQNFKYMKRVFLFLAFTGLLFLTSCGSTESCRTRKSAYKVQKTPNKGELVYSDENLENR